MPVPSPYLIVLSAEEEAVLAARARSVRTQYRDRLRAQIVLAAAAGKNNAAIAGQVGVHMDTVRKWRRLFAATRLAGLKDAPRSGRPPVFTAADRAEVIALACALPAESGVPLSKWSCPELARELATRRQIAVSASTIRRWLASDALKPWQHRSWISVRDPAFAAQAARVLDLYAGIWDGAPLGSNDYVICADEKTSIQARCRCHPTLPPGKARALRVEHDYQRGGALAYLAAWDVHRGQVSGRCEHTTGIAPFPAGQAGDERRTLRQRGPGVLDRRQRLLPPRRRLNPADDPRLAERAPDPPAHACLLAGSGRNLLLDRPAQGHQPQ
jgi:transposase